VSVNHRYPLNKASQHPPRTNFGSTQFKLALTLAFRSSSWQNFKKVWLIHTEYFDCPLNAAEPTTSSVAIQQLRCQLYVRKARQQST